MWSHLKIAFTKGYQLKSSVIVIILLKWSLFIWPKEITLSGFYCMKSFPPSPICIRVYKHLITKSLNKIMWRHLWSAINLVLLEPSCLSWSSCCDIVLDTLGPVLLILVRVGHVHLENQDWLIIPQEFHNFSQIECFKIKGQFFRLRI